MRDRKMVKKCKLEREKGKRKMVSNRKVWNKVGRCIYASWVTRIYYIVYLVSFVQNGERHREMISKKRRSSLILRFKEASYFLVSKMQTKNISLSLSFSLCMFMYVCIHQHKREIKAKKERKKE